MPWPAGGSTDLYFRKLGEVAARHLGQPLVIENRPGGSGMNGPATMAKTARPDGYTISQLTISAFRMPHMQKVDWDPINDFTYIIGLAGYTFGIVVKADSPFKTFNDLLDLRARQPGQAFLRHARAPAPRCTWRWRRSAAKAGVQFLHVPFKGYADGAIALMGGHVMVQVDSTGWAKQVDAGAQRLLATLGDKRTRWNAPTVKELGVDTVSNSPFGLVGPKGMPREVGEGAARRVQEIARRSGVPEGAGAARPARLVQVERGLRAVGRRDAEGRTRHHRARRAAAQSKDEGAS